MRWLGLIASLVCGCVLFACSGTGREAQEADAPGADLVDGNADSAGKADIPGTDLGLNDAESAEIPGTDLGFDTAESADIPGTDPGFDAVEEPEVCTPDCDDKECGTDGCDGSCGECGPCLQCAGEGVCEHVPAGEDPYDVCEEEPAQICGLDGTCDGAGECSLWPEGTPCSGSSCFGQIYSPSATCDGAGECAENPAVNCEPYVCAGTSCQVECADDGDCVPLHFCQLEGECLPRQENGLPCTGNNKCITGYCVDGVCCDGACTGVCRACALGGTEGTCTYIPAEEDPSGECGKCKTCNGAGACAHAPGGADPNNDCLAMASNSCGASGMCDGQGACAFWDETTVCSPAECEGTTYVPASKCSGQGMCSGPQPPVDCCPYKCGMEDKCLEQCSSDIHCCDGYICEEDVCVPKKSNGQSCEMNKQCFSQKCVDGFCCDNWCAGQCEACNRPDHVGTCTFMSAITDPEGECGPCRHCSGADACVNAPEGEDPLDHCPEEPQATCAWDGTCSGFGTCRLWPDGTVCKEQTCVNGVAYGESKCSGSGNCLAGFQTSCCPYACGPDGECLDSCVDDADCICPPYSCQDGQCLSEEPEKKPDGEWCEDEGQCESGFCVDGVCCNSNCANVCRNCALPGTAGVCTFMTVNTDPQNECGTCRVCTGFGACVLVSPGTDPKDECDAGWHCDGGECVPD